MVARVLLVDHYDSFTYNLYHLIAHTTGSVPRVISHDAPWTDFIIDDIDAIVLSPGPGRPGRRQDFAHSSALIDRFKGPLLGVCLGHQGLAHHYGAQVVPAPEPVHGRPALIHHGQTDLFDGIPNPFEVIRYHSLCISHLPECIEKTAWTSDGIIMGIRHRERPQWGVQFHPESIGSTFGARLMHNFMARVQSTGRVWSLGRPEAEVVSAARDAYHVEYDIADWVDPEAVFVGLHGRHQARFWLDTTRVHSADARFSYMGEGSGPLSSIVQYDVDTQTLSLVQGDRETTQKVSGFFPWLKTQTNIQTQMPHGLACDFTGGWVGYLGYELKAETGGDHVHTSPHPDAQLIFADRVIAFDHVEQCIYLISVDDGTQATAQAAWRRETAERLMSISAPIPPKLETAPFELSRSNAQYHHDILSCLDEIEAGESYEVCLTAHLIGDAVQDSLSVYRRLRSTHDVPFAAYIDLPDVAIASMSPERFLRVEQDGQVCAQPIKGTAARSKQPQADQLARDGLATSEKDRSENLMIVDLMRNDLGRVCEVGSVHVPRLMNIESYAVHQMVSTISGRLAAGFTGVDVVAACFPGGSMTGAPKKRTMEIIDRLENEARGIYSGAIGYFSINGTIDLNIVIRSAVCSADRTSIGVGGAIVALSNPHDELAEVYLKGRSLTDILGPDDS